MRKLFTGVVVFGLSIAIPATLKAHWFVYAIWIVVALAVLALLAMSDLVKERLPWTIRKRDPEYDAAIGHVLGLFVLRSDLMAALRNLNDNLTNPSLADLRAFADNLSARLRTNGYTLTAKKVEVFLPDNADSAAVKKRRDEIWTALTRMLIWDEYQ